MSQPLSEETLIQLSRATECRPGCVDGWVALDWAGLTTLVRRGPNWVQLRSARLVVDALPPDFAQEEPPGQVAAYLDAEIRWQATVEARYRLARLPTAVVLDIGGREARFDVAGAAGLASALMTLADAAPAADALERRSWVEEPQPCPRCDADRG